MRRKPCCGKEKDHPKGHSPSVGLRKRSHVALRLFEGRVGSLQQILEKGGPRLAAAVSGEHMIGPQRKHLLAYDARHRNGLCSVAPAAVQDVRFAVESDVAGEYDALVTELHDIDYRIEAVAGHEHRLDSQARQGDLGFVANAFQGQRHINRRRGP